MKKPEETESKLVLEVKNELWIRGLQVKHHRSLGGWQEVNDWESFVLKKYENLKNSNEQLENNVTAFRNNLNKSNLTLQCMIAGKSMMDEILGAQLLGNKHQGLRYVQQESQNKSVVLRVHLLPSQQPRFKYQRYIHHWT